MTESQIATAGNNAVNFELRLGNPSADSAFPTLLSTIVLSENYATKNYGLHVDLYDYINNNAYINYLYNNGTFTNTINIVKISSIGDSNQTVINSDYLSAKMFVSTGAVYTNNIVASESKLAYDTLSGTTKTHALFYNPVTKKTQYSQELTINPAGTLGANGQPYKVSIRGALGGGNTLLVSQPLGNIAQFQADDLESGGAYFGFQNNIGGLVYFGIDGAGFISADLEDKNALKFGSYYNSAPTMIMVNGVTILEIKSGSVRPRTDNAISLGDSTHRWSAIYSQNGSIQTSDQREKTNIAASDLGLSFINMLQPVKYKYIVGGKTATTVPDPTGTTIPGCLPPTKLVVTDTPGTRTHYGLIAQQVKTTLDTIGCEDFGGFLLADKADPNSLNMLRYEEFIGPLIKSVQELTSTVTSLQANVSTLMNK